MVEILLLKRLCTYKIAEKLQSFTDVMSCVQQNPFRRLSKNDKLHFMWDTVVEEVGGDGILSWMTVKNVKTGEVTKIEADEDDGMFGVFGFIGTIPNADIFKGKC